MDVLRNWEFSCPANKRVLQERRGHARKREDANHHDVKMNAGPFEEGWHMGMLAHYNYIGEAELRKQVAARRMPCECEGCDERLKRPIDERYIGPCKECIFYPIFQIGEEIGKEAYEKLGGECGWNDYRLLQFTPTKKCSEEECQDLDTCTMQGIGRMMGRSVEKGGYGAYTVSGWDEKAKKVITEYYLVQWTTKAWEVKENMVVKIGTDDKEYQLFEEEWVAKGKWLYKVPRAAHWYYVGQDEVLVRMQQTLNSNLDMAPHSDSNPLP